MYSCLNLPLSITTFASNNVLGVFMFAYGPLAVRFATGFLPPSDPRTVRFAPGFHSPVSRDSVVELDACFLRITLMVSKTINTKSVKIVIFSKNNVEKYNKILILNGKSDFE